MDLIILIVFALSITSLAIALKSLYMLKKYTALFIDELSTAILTRKKSRRVKRYILLKIVCNEDANPKIFIYDLHKRLSKFLGELDKIDCGITVAAFSKDSGRAILRVVGDYRCVKRVLVALSIQHIVFGDCIAIPIKTSGLLSRLRKFL